jgi:hypothetical protein
MEGQTVAKFDKVSVVSNEQRLRLRGLKTKCDFVLSTQFGYLQRKVDGWYKTWSEQFFVLTDIGLVIMTNPFDINMEYFQCKDFKITQAPYQEFQKNWVLKLQPDLSGDFDKKDLILQACSDADFDQWMYALAEFTRR